MKYNLIPEAQKSSKYKALFGDSMFKGIPLYIYAEHLFICGMEQMVSQYEGGLFDFAEIIEADVEIEPSGFFPLLDVDGDMQVTSPFGASQTMSAKAASLVVWIFCLGQIANDVKNEKLQARLYYVIQDINYCYARLTNAQGDKLLNEADCRSAYKLLD